MLELGERLGAQTLATGHYARVEQGRLLRIASDVAKDQSYVLSALSPDSLARMRFPLGEMRKEQVRGLARAAGLEVARKPDSQDLCFLAGTRHSAFLERHGELGERPGPIIDSLGAVLGEHRGAHSYTVGQRHGLGIGAAQPLYVLQTDTLANTVTVGPRDALLAAELPVRELTLHRHGECVDGVRVRSHGRRLQCRLSHGLDAGRHASARIELAQPSERTAPGQIACLYAGELVVGYGTIAS
jgi:tRNA-specific 2-thiouridylase